MIKKYKYLLLIICSFILIIGFAAGYIICYTPEYKYIEFSEFVNDDYNEAYYLEWQIDEMIQNYKDEIIDVYGEFYISNYKEITTAKRASKIGRKEIQERFKINYFSRYYSKFEFHYTVTYNEEKEYWIVIQSPKKLIQDGESILIFDKKTGKILSLTR